MMNFVQTIHLRNEQIHFIYVGGQARTFQLASKETTRGQFIVRYRDNMGEDTEVSEPLLSPNAVVICSTEISVKYDSKDINEMGQLDVRLEELK